MQTVRESSLLRHWQHSDCWGVAPCWVFFPGGFHKVSVMWNPPLRVKCSSRNLALKGFDPGLQVDILGKTIWIKPCWASWPWGKQTVWLSELHLSKVSSCLRWDYFVHLIPREGILCALINSRCMTQHPQLDLGKASVLPMERKVLWKLKGHMIQAVQLICNHTEEMHTDKRKMESFCGDVEVQQWAE